MTSRSNFSCFCAEKFRFSAEFIEMRRQALDVFVNRIASHHELQQSEDLRTFLQADEEVIKLTSCAVVCSLFAVHKWDCWSYLYFVTVYCLTNVVLNICSYLNIGNWYKKSVITDDFLQLSLHNIVSLSKICLHSYF